MDLDDEELKATRRMNGSDKNVVSLKEDIEGLKRLFYANALTQYGKRKLIGYYEQQIKELEENSIPVSLVEEKIEENNKIMQETEKKYKGTYAGLDEYRNALAQNKVLQELLEKR